MASTRLPVMEKLLLLRNNLTPIYPFGGPARFKVPSDKIDWNIDWPEYSPPSFTTDIVSHGKKPWCDKEITNPDFHPKWNSIDLGVNRKSFDGVYSLDSDGYPLNLAGRTGLRGRGNLGRWGPNHAADPIVSRWKRINGTKVTQKDATGEEKFVMQFIAIQRRDTLDWAIPGGMVDGNESIESALKREFLEEVFGIEDATKEEEQNLNEKLGEIFKSYDVVYEGYVDDRRNTDNAWIETTAVNFHVKDEHEEIILSLELKAGSDAKNAKWVDISKSLPLYASHSNFIETIVKKYNAFW